MNNAIKYNQSNVSMKGMFDTSVNSGTPNLNNNHKKTKTGRNTTYHARSPCNGASQAAGFGTNPATMTPQQQQQVQQEQLNNLNMI